MSDALTPIVPKAVRPFRIVRSSKRPNLCEAAFELDDALEVERNALGQNFGGGSCQCHDGLRATGTPPVILRPPTPKGDDTAASVLQCGAVSGVHRGRAIYMLVGLRRSLARNTVSS